MGVFESLLNRTFTSYRRERTSDGQGGWVVSYNELGEVEGRIRPATSKEREVAAQQGREVTHVLYVLAEEDVERGDREVYGDLTVEVAGIREPSRAGEHLEVDCVERQGEAAT